MTTKLEIFLASIRYTLDKDDYAVIIKDIIHELLRGQLAKEEALGEKP